ncbi:hypothetical protein [Aliagarivorans taiwanensis]|uniref:hypothetical protein n=1 Tax=Aliagarivorans taiwanensis TaxID=561966 RepID=UPI0004249565|nr:hypothetical protein [Aliagarivorans taiwanensis]
MFAKESDLQELVHQNPDLILSGIPEISPTLCCDTPQLVSLGRELPLASGAVDNLYVDINGVLTFVECKRYCDGRLKREVYPQALNYASDMQNQFVHYQGQEFISAFTGYLHKAGIIWEDVVGRLADDKLLSGKRLDDWKRQFYSRLEYNIKAGICRVVILCSPAPSNNFNAQAIRNLMQLMSFSERTARQYDFLLMDLRQSAGEMISKIIWRSYAYLPQIPLIAEASRDSSASVEAMRARFDALEAEQREMLDSLFEELSKRDITARENTLGFALYKSTSMYIQIFINPDTWTLVRHQIHSSESTYQHIESGKLEGLLGIHDSKKVKIESKKSSLSPKMYQVTIFPFTFGAVSKFVEAVEMLSVDAD